MTIRQYAAEDVEAVRQFNHRLQSGGAKASFPLSPVSAWLPKIAGRRLFQEHYLAVEDAAVVRGGYILKHQDFWIKDRVVNIADFHLPISEGAVNKGYPQVGVQLLRDALDRQPLLFGLGMGSYEESLPRLFRAAGWSMFSVPFFFRVVRPRAFLQNVVHLRRSAAGQVLLDALAMTGLGWAGISAAQNFFCRQTRRDSNIVVEPVDEFSAWADELWETCKGQYGMSAARDAETLRILYPKSDGRFLRLKISALSRLLGWVVALNTQLTNHKYFGNMRLGSIADCFASVTDTVTIVRAAREYLESQGVDLIVSNQSHAAWRRGFRQAGFLRGPSNFIFAASKELSKLLQQEGVRNDDLHFNRGDGDGPINL